MKKRSKSKQDIKRNKRVATGSGGAARRTKNVPLETRPTSIYWPDHIDEVQAIAGRGLTDEEMAIFLGVTPDLLESWKAYYPRFADAIERGQTRADAQVIGALFKNAIGYDYEDEVVVRGRRGAMVLQTKRHMPAETNAQKFWLSNRAPERWGEKVSLNHGSKPGSPVLVKQETREEVIHSILNMIVPQPDDEVPALSAKKR